MIDWLRRKAGGNRSAGWSLAGVERPWPPGAGIADHVRANLDADGRYRGGFLPDWRRIREVSNQHGRNRPRPIHPARLVGRVRAVVEHPDARSLAGVERAIADGAVFGYPADVRRALDGSGLERPRVAELGRVLAEEAPRRDVARIGIVLIGYGGDLERDRMLLADLGACEEFSFSATGALTSLGATDRDLRAFATRLWGESRRCVVDLFEGTTDPDTRAWLLRKGVDWPPPYEPGDAHLALACARIGGLAEALDGAAVDPELMAGATAILRALVDADGDGDDDRDVVLGQYADAVRVVRAWLGHVEAAPTAEAIAAIDAFTAHASVAPGDPLPGDLVAQLAAFGASDAARQAIVDGLRSTDALRVCDISVVAPAHGVDPYPHLLARVGDAGRWLGATVQALIDVADPDRLGEVVDVVRDVLDPAVVANGPTLQPGADPGADQHPALRAIVAALKATPGMGSDLVLLALRNPWVSTRQRALWTLAAWPPETWPDSAPAALRAAAAEEPDPDLRKAMLATLA